MSNGKLSTVPEPKVFQRVQKSVKEFPLFKKKTYRVPPRLTKIWKPKPKKV